MNAMVSIPRAPVNVRDATLADVAFMDSLQKLHADRVGFMRTSWIEAKIAKGEVIVAHDETGQPVGYCMGVDRYFKRDDVGIIHQLNVAPGKQRGYVGMVLLQAMVDRAAYGCRLYCCWCAQDIEANRFWEAMGFVPLAYRAGSAKKARLHIFWQKRIREGDTATPWWFPVETTGGAIGEGRIVLPIPPGKHWSDELPVLLPKETKRIAGPAAKKAKEPRRPVSTNLRDIGGLRFAAPKAPDAQKPKEKTPRERKRNDPKLVAAARELRDRWLEHVNENNVLGAGKYDVTRALPEHRAPAALLPAA